MPSEHNKITAKELSDVIRDGDSGFLLVDVRTREEFTDESIPSAVNVPLDEIESKIGVFSQHKKIFIFCQAGVRSNRAYGLLANNGIKNIIDLQGGIVAWKQARLPTTIR